jgi:signal transduction histidine kinase
VRGRLLAIVLSLVALLVLGLGIPLALSVASREQQRTFLDRLTDTSRFASLAQRALTEDKPELIAPELRRYRAVYGDRAVVLGAERRVAASSLPPEPSAPPAGSGVPRRTRVDLDDPVVAKRVGAAFAGRQPESGPLLVPWDGSPVVVAEPVLVDGELRGVALTVSSTHAARMRILGWWCALAAGAVAAFCLALLAALPVVRWVLRPVRRLDEAAAGLAAAIVAGKQVQPVGADTGPPELRRLSRSYDAMAGSVVDVVAAQRAFVADASHQLRNPLTALRLRLSNLAEHVAGAGAAEQAAAASEAERLTRFADELLVMARAEAGTADPVEVDVDAVVADRLAAWQVAARAREIDLVLAGRRGGRALAPARGLEAVLDAVLDNAVKFVPHDSIVEVAIGRGGAEGAERVTVAVRDHGPGLRPEQLARATERFWRAPGQQNVSGSGLGLAIATRIVARVAGQVSLDLPEGGGLRVTVTLPGA